jgi:predicted glycosyltransferase
MRCLLYSPDSYGLGHISRSLAIANSLLERFPDSRVRLLTGAPRAHFFDYPHRCDYVVLPGVTKDGAGRYVSAAAGQSLDETVRTRGRLVEHEILHFKPDVFLVDHSPLGLCGDLREVLTKLSRNPDVSVILGLRDVIDTPERVRADWERDGVFELIASCYDAVLVYGDPAVFNPVRSYGFPHEVAAKTTFTGYIGAYKSGLSSPLVHSLFAPRTGKLLLITLGGGGDGNLLLGAAYGALQLLGPLPPFETLSVTGPLMSPGKRGRFKRRAGELARLTQLEFTPALFELIQCADLVLSMGGYNTICELAAANANALVVPRDRPRKEQIIRARHLETRGALRVLEPRNATPERIAHEIEVGLERRPPAAGWGLPFTALERVAEKVRQLRFAGAEFPAGSS